MIVWNWTFSLYEEVSNEKLLKNDTRFRTTDDEYWSIKGQNEHYRETSFYLFTSGIQ